MKWEDTSTYSRTATDTGGQYATTWSLDLDGMRVQVHRMHGVDGIWFGSCHAMGVEQHQLSAPDYGTARKEFLGYLFARATRWVSKLDRASKRAR